MPLIQDFVELRTSAADDFPVFDAPPALYAIPDNSSVVVDLQVECHLLAEAQSKTFNVRRIFRNVAGTVTSIGQTSTLGPFDLGDPLNVSVAIDNDDTDLTITLTSDDVQDLLWRVDHQIVAMVEFDPLTLGDCVLWLDAAPPYTTPNMGNTAVDSFTDRAGVSTPTIPGQAPGYDPAPAEFTGPVFSFLDAMNAQAVEIDGHTLTNTAFTVVIVGTMDAGYALNEPNGNMGVAGGGGSGHQFEISSDAFGTTLTGSGDARIQGVYIGVFDGTTSVLYRNSATPIASGPSGTLADLTGLTLVVGNASPPSTGGRQNGLVRHFLLYKGALGPSACATLLTGFGAEVIPP